MRLNRVDVPVAGRSGSGRVGHAKGHGCSDCTLWTFSPTAITIEASRSATCLLDRFRSGVKLMPTATQRAPALLVLYEDFLLMTTPTGSLMLLGKDFPGQAGQSHSRSAVWVAASITTSHSTGGGAYGRNTSETGLSTTDGRDPILNGWSSVWRTGGTYPMLPFVPPRRIPDSSRWSTFGPITSLARSQVP